MIFVFLAHMGWGSNWTLSAALLQRLTPDYIRGRIFSMDLGLLTLTLAASTFLTGVATDVFDPRYVAMGLGVIFIAFGAVWALTGMIIQRRFPTKWETGSMNMPRLEENPETALAGAE